MNLKEKIEKLMDYASKQENGEIAEWVSCIGVYCILFVMHDYFSIVNRNGEKLVTYYKPDNEIDITVLMSAWTTKYDQLPKDTISQMIDQLKLGDLL